VMVIADSGKPHAHRRLEEKGGKEGRWFEMAQSTWRMANRNGSRTCLPVGRGFSLRFNRGIPSNEFGILVFVLGFH
jgi:hypothetical protein